MLFLAVFCGFLAENYREHKLEHEREKRYIKNLYEDLVADTVIYSSYIKNTQEILSIVDSMMLLMKSPDRNTHLSRIYFLSRITTIREPIVSPNDRTFDEMKSSVIKATFTNPMGEAKIEMYWMKPNKVFIKQAMQGMESTMGSDGTVSWMRTPMDTTILDPEQAKDLQDQSNMFRMVIRIRDDATELATVDQVKFNEFDCYKIRATDKNGQAQFALFDVKDHLIRGLETDEAGQGPATVKFSEWKEDAGIKYFTKVEIERMGMAMPLTFDEVKFNTLDETTFALPDDIKAMLKDKDDGAASKPATTNPAGPGGH